MRSILVQAVAAVLVLASGALAAPLDQKQVAADAKWLAHLDLDAVRGSTVVQKAWKRGMEQCKDAETKLSFVRSMLNMDPTKDVRSITFLYGKQIGKPSGVAIVSAAMDPDRILGLTAALPGRETSKHGDCDVHCWTRKHHDHTWTIAAAFRSKEQLIVGNSVESVNAALDVLDGKSPGLSDDASLSGHIPAGTTFLLRAQGIAQADLHCKIPVVKQIDSFRLVTGENKGQSFYRARYTMTNADTASQGLAVVNGWKAQANLLCPDELVRKLVAGINPKADGKTLTILWSASTDDVWAGLQKLEKVIAKHHAKHKHGGKHRHDGDKADGGKSDGEKKSQKKPVSPEEDF